MQHFEWTNNLSLEFNHLTIKKTNTKLIYIKFEVFLSEKKANLSSNILLKLRNSNLQSYYFIIIVNKVLNDNSILRNSFKLSKGSYYYCLRLINFSHNFMSYVNVSICLQPNYENSIYFIQQIFIF